MYTNYQIKKRQKLKTAPFKAYRKNIFLKINSHKISHTIFIQFLRYQITKKINILIC